MRIKPVIALGNESRGGGAEVKTVGRKERGVAGPPRGPDGRQQGKGEGIKHPPPATTRTGDISFKGEDTYHGFLI